MPQKIGLVSLGCPKNLIDSEVMLGLFKKHGYVITNDKEDAHILLVNTCGFIESAKQESINTILEMAECKKDKCRYLIVTGCLAERYKDEIIKEIPDVDAVVGTGNVGEILEVIEKLEGGEKSVCCGKLDELEYLGGERVVSTGKGYAYLKIAEGCDNCCTYCVIPSLRGRYRSRKMEELVSEAQYLVSQGIKEIILVAQDTTRYGIDIYGERRLTELIRKLSELEGVFWIRLLYCYPDEIDDALIDEMANNPKVCKYIDMPIQHISDRILKTMGRRGTSEDIKAVTQKLRSRMPEIVIRSSLIVGFPGEDEEDFAQLQDFVQKYKFDRLGIFIYSKEEGTPAARMKPQVSKKVKQARLDTLMELQKTIALERNVERVERAYATMVGGVSEDGIFYYGRTYGEAPEIDGLVYFTSPEPLEAGDLVTVKILNTDDYDLIGAVLDESCE